MTHMNGPAQAAFQSLTPLRTQDFNDCQASTLACVPSSQTRAPDSFLKQKEYD